MKVGLHADFGNVFLMLKSVGEGVPDTARGQMKRAARRIVERAKIYVPEDTQELKDSIRVERTRDERRRLQITVTVGGLEIISANGVTIDLDQYALIIHERYSEMEPGDVTLEKMASYPDAPIGEKFLTNAARDEKEGLERNMIAEIEKVVRRSDKK